ncbi:TonB-dependent receptor family protein [Piscirickettsia salmonis]|nr:TonB-dependent siderophore receptor [Piscirickettsia salmonis]
MDTTQIMVLVSLTSLMTKKTANATKITRTFIAVTLSLTFLQPTLAKATSEPDQEPKHKKYNEKSATIPSSAKISSEQSTLIENTQLLVINGNWLGSSTKKDVKSYPGARNIISQQQIEQSGAQDIQEVLRQVPSIRVQDETSGTGVLPNISVRGLNPLRSVDLQVLVDGIPLALAPYSQTGLSLFPVTLDTVEKIDIVRGGAAVQYGPNNVGGVINIITKPIPNQKTTTLKQSVTAAATGQFLSKSYVGIGGFITDNFGAQLQINTTRGNGDRQHTNTKINNILLNTDYWPSETTEMKANLQYYDADAELPGALTPEQYNNNWRQSNTPDNRYQAHALRASLIISHDFTPTRNLTWSNYFNKSYRNFSWQDPGIAGVTPTDIAQSPRDFLVFGTEPRYSQMLGTSIKQKIILGARYLHEGISYPVYTDNIATVATTTTRSWGLSTNAYAAYASDTLYFNNDRLQITPGLRYERVAQNFTDRLAGSAINNNLSELLPGLTIGYQISQPVYLFANAQRSLLAPQLSQVANSNGQSLAAEKAWNYELGSRVNWNKQISTTVTLFKTDFQDKIEKQGNDLVNIGASREQGIETQLHYTPDFLANSDFTLGYTYLNTEIIQGENKGNQMPYAAKNQFSFISNYHYKQWTYNLSGYYVGSAFSDAANTTTEQTTQGPIPNYWLWNTAITRSFKLAHGANAQIGFSIQNLFDERYFFRNVDVSQGITPAPGRSFTLSASLTF